MNVTRALDGLAILLEYPEPGFHRRLQAIIDDVITYRASLRGSLEEFAGPAARLGIHELEELYTRTFDINPVCSQEVGWQVFGETYDRGGFLVKINDALREHDVPPSKELGDHLPQMLRLFARSDPAEQRGYAIGFLDPAIEKMLGAFGDGPHPYKSLLTCVREALGAEMAEIEPEERHVQ